MNICCLICNSGASTALNNAANIFGDKNTLQSGKKLSDVVSEILNKLIQEEHVHTNVLCNKCYKSCMEYDMMQTRLDSIKSELLARFKQTLPSHNLVYETYEKYATTRIIEKPKLIVAKKVVLPASKLQPIPPDLLMKVGKFAQFTKPNILMPKMKSITSSTLNLKVTVGTSVLTHTIKTSKPSNAQTNTTSSLMNTVKEEMTSYVIEESLPGNDENVSLKIERNNDERHKQIEDCSLSMVKRTQDGNLVLEVEGLKEKRQDSSSTSEFIEVSMPTVEDPEGNTPKYIIGKLELLNENEEDDDDEEHTIVVEGDNGLLRMVSGQKLIYSGGEISFMLPDENSSLNDADDQPDSQDSNDESQIELQVSGDEIATNAILAAAQEDGGAIIKVENGDIYRVQPINTELDSPGAQVVERQGKEFRCLLCDNNEGPSTSGDAEKIMRHLKSVHGARIYICQLCGAVMRKRGDYTTHIADHAQKAKNPSSLYKRNTYACTVCARSYNSKTLLGEHMNVHTGVRPYPCSLCDKAFASKYTHQAHLKTHSDRPRPFKCEQCNKSFLTQQNLNQHEKTHSGIKDFVCSVCNKAFSTQHNLEVHSVVHSGNKAFVCSTCDKAFARRAELRDHIRIHTGERPFKCEVCGAAFTQRSNLNSHKRATHLDDKRHHCDRCPKRFKRRRLLEYHIKSSHTGERPLVCNVCHASFVYPEHYKKHVRIHSGERPYVCEICGKSFNSRDNRNTHRFVHSDKKPYECVQCGAGYMRKQLLYAHMNTSGHLAESIVVNQPRMTKITENGVNSELVTIQGLDSKENDLTQAIFEAALDTPDKSGSDKGTLNLVEDADDTTLLTIHNIEDGTQGTLLETVNADQLETPQIESNSENGMVRLIQIKLPDGNDGWVALNR